MNKQTNKLAFYFHKRVGHKQRRNYKHFKRTF